MGSTCCPSIKGSFFLNQFGTHLALHLIIHLSEQFMLYLTVALLLAVAVRPGDHKDTIKVLRNQPLLWYYPTLVCISLYSWYESYELLTD